MKKMLYNVLIGALTIVSAEAYAQEPACQNFQYYLADSPQGTSTSDIYGVVLNGGNADLTYLTTVNYQAHLAFNEETKVLYIVNRNNGAFESFDVPNNTITGPTALSSSLPNVAAATISPDGDLLLGDETSDNVYVVDVATGTRVQLAGESLTIIDGGDLLYGANGTLYYASRNGGGLLIDVLTNAVVGNMPAAVTGAALTEDGDILTSSRNFDDLHLYGPAGSAAAITTYATFLDGNPIVVKSTDLASGCLSSEFIEEGCFASEMLAYNPGPKSNGQPITDPNRIDPDKALGAPQLDDTFNFVSLGYGGELILGFDGVVLNGPGNDLLVAETTFGNNTFDTYAESADVYVSQDGVNYFMVGSLFTKDAAEFEIDAAGQGFTYIIAVKIVDTTPGGSVSDDAFDVDGVEALNGCGPIPDVPPGDCYATEMVEYVQGTKSNGGPITPNRTNANNALGEPEGIDALVFVTLGYGGSITLGFNGAVLNGAGDDLEIVETSYGTVGCNAYREYADIHVSQNGTDFFFARTICKSDNFVDISDAGQGFGYITHVKVVNNNTLTFTPDAYDLDGIRAIYNCPEESQADDASEVLASINTTNVISTFPNPTTGPSVVNFTTVETSLTTLEVYDMNGRNISTIFNQVANGGQEYRVNFEGTFLPNGVYIYRLTTGNEVIVEKFMIAR